MKCVQVFSVNTDYMYSLMGGKYALDLFLTFIVTSLTYSISIWGMKNVSLPSPPNFILF